jgi:hypothetical protein
MYGLNSSRPACRSVSSVWPLPELRSRSIGRMTYGNESDESRHIGFVSLGTSSTLTMESRRCDERFAGLGFVRRRKAVSRYRLN